MIKRMLISLVIGAAIGYTLSPQPDQIEKERIVYKERIARRTVRTTTPDGTIKETITETENRSGKETRSKQINKRKYFVGVSYGVLGQQSYQVDTGMRLIGNVALKVSYVRQGGDDALLAGIQVDF